MLLFKILSPIKTIVESFDKNKDLTSVSGLNIYEYDNYFKKFIVNFLSISFFYSCKIAALLGIPKVIAPNIAIKRNILKKVRGFDDVISEDYYLGLKLRKLKNIKCRLDRRMKIECSSRRMRKVGIIKTHWIWFTSALKRKKFEKYGFHDKI